MSSRSPLAPFRGRSEAPIPQNASSLKAKDVRRKYGLVPTQGKGIIGSVTQFLKGGKKTFMELARYAPHVDPSLARVIEHDGIAVGCNAHAPSLKLAQDCQCAHSLTSPSSFASSASGEDSTGSIHSIGGFFEFFATVSGFVFFSLVKEFKESTCVRTGLDSLSDHSHPAPRPPILRFTTARESAARHNVVLVTPAAFAALITSRAPTAPSDRYSCSHSSASLRSEWSSRSSTFSTSFALRVTTPDSHFSRGSPFCVSTRKANPPMFGPRFCFTASMSLRSASDGSEAMAQTARAAAVKAIDAMARCTAGPADFRKWLTHNTATP